jgi:hypothetical protein
VPPKELLDSSPLVLQGIFDEFFLGHPNDPPEWIPYDPAVNGRVDIYGYYWKAPVAIKTHPPSAMVGTPVTFDGSASYGFRNVLGVLVPDITYIASYDWDFGDLTPHGAGAIVVHTYTSTGIFTVTLTVTDLDGKTGSVSQPINIFSTWNLYLVIIGSPGDLVLLNPGPPGPLDPPVAYGPGTYTLVYNPGVTVTATMIPNAGEDFNWVIDVTPGTSNPMLPIWMISPHWVTVNFFYINIDVYIGPGTGAYPSPYGGQGHNRIADMFEPQKTVCVWIKVTWNGEPVQTKIVTIIVLSPHNLHDFSRTAITDANGMAYIEFGLPWPCDNPWDEIFGIWQIVTKVDIRSTVYEDTVWFKVYWLLEIVSVVTDKATYTKGDWVDAIVVYRTWRMQPFNTVLEITVYDDLDVPIGSTRGNFYNLGWGDYNEERFWACTFKYYLEELEIKIPKWAFVGTGKVYANAFHFDPQNPYNMGVPMCPEKMTTFTILKWP